MDCYQLPSAIITQEILLAVSILPLQHEGKGWTNELHLLTSQKTWLEWRKMDCHQLPGQRACTSWKVNAFKIKMVRIHPTKVGATFIKNSMICHLCTNRQWVHRWAASFNIRTFPRSNHARFINEKKKFQNGRRKGMDQWIPFIQPHRK